MKLGNLDIAKIYLGSAEVTKMSIGDTTIYEGGGGEPYVISANTVLSEPLDLPNREVIIEQGVTVSTTPMLPIIINCKKLTNNGTITADGMGWQSSRNSASTDNDVYGNGYARAGYSYGQRTVYSYGTIRGMGGAYTDSTMDFARRTMEGLVYATPGVAARVSPNSEWGGTAGTLGGGGGAGSDGGEGTGGGSGAGGGGGSRPAGSYGGRGGGDGSQADPIVNLQLFKEDKFADIPLFGGAGGYGPLGGAKRGLSDGGGNIQIFASNIENNGIITANGISTALSTPNAYDPGGIGGGGGGCIMFRCNSYINNGTVQALGSEGLGSLGYGSYTGGKGGDGLILIDDSGYSLPSKNTITFQGFDNNIVVSENNMKEVNVANNNSIQVNNGSFIKYNYGDKVFYNFNASNYIQTKSINLTSGTWEVCIAAKFDTIGTNQVGFCSAPLGWGINYYWEGTRTYKGIAVELSSNGSSFNIGSMYTTFNFETNTWYKLKIEFTGTEYIYSISTNGGPFIVQDSISSSTTISVNSPFTLGCDRNGTYTSGSYINLTKTYIKVDGDYIFDGSTAVEGTDYTIYGSLDSIYDSTKYAYINKNFTLTPASDIFYAYTHNNDNIFSKDYNLNKSFNLQNISINGTLAGSNGIYHAFSSSNYLVLSNQIGQQSDLEINIAFITGSDVQTTQYFFGSAPNSKNVIFGLYQGRIGLWVSSNNSNWNICEGGNSYSLSPNKYYEVNLTYSNNTYIYKIKDNGEWHEVDNMPNQPQIYLTNDYIGGNIFDSHYFYGSIDLRKCYIRVGNTTTKFYNETLLRSFVLENATISGTLTENSGVYSGFSRNNYFTYGTLPTITTSGKIIFKVKYDNTISQYSQSLIGLNNKESGLIAYNDSGTDVLRYWDKDAQDGINGTTTLENDSTYWIALELFPSQVKCYLIKDNSNTYTLNTLPNFSSSLWNQEFVFNTNVFQNVTVRIGQPNTDYNENRYWRGTIDMSNSIFVYDSTTISFGYFVGKLYDSNFDELTLQSDPTIEDGNIIIDNVTYERNPDNDEAVNKTSFPYTVVGSPTITGPLVSNFTTNDYLISKNCPRECEITLKFNTGSNTRPSQMLLYSDNWIYLYVANSAVYAYHYKNADTYTLFNITGNSDIILKFKGAVVDGSYKKTYRWSIDGGTTWNDHVFNDDVAPEISADVFYGIEDGNYPATYFSFDLSQSSIMLPDGSYFISPYNG